MTRPRGARSRPAAALLAAAIALLALPATGAAEDGSAAGRLTISERRILDGAYLYMVAPEYCAPPPDAAVLRSWVAGQLRARDIPAAAIVEYIRAEEPRLRVMAGALFTGGRGQELCAAIRAALDEAAKDAPGETGETTRPDPE